MHPETTIRHICAEKGLGVVARQAIAAGTLVWVRDPLDRALTPSELTTLPQFLREHALTYMYRNHLGEYLLLWDHGKYVNHSFSPNCMPTPYGCDIALKDIAEGEELTEDYGLLNIIEEFSPQKELMAGRSVVSCNDLCLHAAQWDSQLYPALLRIHSVHQPLWSLLPSSIQQELRAIEAGALPRSVSQMRLL